MDEVTARAAALLRDARHATAFTGAGISVESGIPPFRGPGGLWSRVDPEFIEIGHFLGYPEESWRRIKDLFYDHFGQAQPNAAHFGLAALEAAGRLKAVITQNIDDLHQQAGSREVIEFHGNSRWLLCLECGSRAAVRPDSPVPCPVASPSRRRVTFVHPPAASGRPARDRPPASGSWPASPSPCSLASS